MWTSLALSAMVVAYPAPRDIHTADKGPGYLGITFEGIEDGIHVTEVRSDGPAMGAGIRANDIIRKFDGEPIQFDQFARKIVRLRAGTVVPLEVQRGEERLVIKVKLGVRPEEFPYPLPTQEENGQPDLPNLPPPFVPDQ